MLQKDLANGINVLRR